MPVAQLDRAFPSEGKGRAFDSHQAQIKEQLTLFFDLSRFDKYFLTISIEIYLTVEFLHDSIGSQGVCVCLYSR